MKISPLTQLDAMDCGPTCLRMVAKFYGRSYSLQYLRERCHITREGVSLLGISDAAEAIGFRTTGVKITWKQLRDEMPFPCIVHWNQRHFVVVYGVAKRRKGIFVKMADPASGLLEYRAEDFLKSWLQAEGKTEGIALMLEPTPQFYQEEGEEKQKYGFGYVFQYMLPYRSYIQILLAMLKAQKGQVGSLVLLDAEQYLLQVKQYGNILDVDRLAWSIYYMFQDGERYVVIARGNLDYEWDRSNWPIFPSFQGFGAYLRQTQ